MILPLSALFAAGHALFRARGFALREIDSGGRRVLLYDRRGSGSAPPVLLLHGLGGSAASFALLAARLGATSRRVLVLDLPGHGRNRLRRGEEAASLLEQAQALGTVLAEVGSARPFVVASERWSGLELPVEPAARWTEVPSHRIDDAAKAARAGDGVVAIGGGSAIDLGKAISAATGLPLVSVPATYAGAEWTPYFGVRDPGRRMHGGGSGAHLAGAVYEPKLTLDLPREVTGGTALNALAHCCEALYARGRDPTADPLAFEGAEIISSALPRVLDEGHDVDARTELLRGAARAGCAGQGLPGGGLPRYRSGVARSPGRSRNSCNRRLWYFSVSPTHSMPIRRAVATARAFAGRTSATTCSMPCPNAHWPSASPASVA